MPNGDAALAALKAESQQAIDQLSEVPGAKSCGAHEHMARATVLMLRWQIAIIDHYQASDRRVRNIGGAAIIAAICAGVISGNAASILQFVRALVG